MSHAKETKAANIRALIQLHGEHSRHIENERTWYLVSYMIGIGTLLSQTAANKDVLKWILPVLLVPTAVGLALCVRWSKAFDIHKNIIDELVVQLGIKIP